MIPRIASGLVVLFLGGLVLVPTNGAQTVKVGITSKTLFFMPYYVGQKKGFYAAENIRIEPVMIGRSDVQLAALLSGELQIGSLNADATIVINEKGGNLKVIAGVDNSAPYILVGGKPYKKIDDLKGARIGVAALRGGATSILLDYLKSKGLLYPRDFAMKAHQQITTEITPRGFLELCLVENDRRLDRYDARLLRPRLVPTIAKALCRVLP